MDEPTFEPMEPEPPAGRSRFWTVATFVLALAMLVAFVAVAAWLGASLGDRPQVAVSTWTPIPRPSALVTFTPTTDAPQGTPTPRVRPTRPPATATPAPQASGTPRVHVIQSGESLLSIARDYRVDYEELLRLNHIEDPNRIFVGESLLLPESEPTPLPGSVEHTVQQGETLFQIALLYDVSMEAIMAANGITNSDTLLVGQRLIIPPPSVTVTPAT